MGHITRTLVLAFLVGGAWMGAVPPLAAAQQGTAGGPVPTPDGRLQVRTTTIDADLGVNWEEAALRFNGQVYPFVLQAQTNTASDVLTSRIGEHINVNGLVYRLKQISDFAGTYTRLTPERARAIAGPGNDAVFQNGTGVAIQVMRGPRSESLYLSLLGDSFQVFLSGF
jgi:hypothetical protein